MKYICDASDGKTWFRIETEVEAEQESNLMHHTMEKYFRLEIEEAAHSFKPTSTVFIERNIGFDAHIQREMAIFLTLRDAEGNGLATAMLPPGGRDDSNFQIIIVGSENSDPYSEHEEAIRALGVHFGLSLNRERCFAYRRSSRLNWRQ